jgi:hypothetical protein
MMGGAGRSTPDAMYDFSRCLIEHGRSLTQQTRVGFQLQSFQSISRVGF